MLDELLDANAPTPLIVITGPTASGKSDLALMLAERYGGEIICADSRTVYRGMDIGSAKPSQSDILRVPHHLLDIANADVVYTASDFQRDALHAIGQIFQRGRIPFVVGGSGLYIDGLIRNYQFGAPADENRRQELAKLSVSQLQTMLKKQQIALPENQNNKRYLIRALEQGDINRRRSKKLHPQIHVVAITTEKLILEQRIRQRIDRIFEAGIIAETEALIRDYGMEHEALTGNIYPAIKRYIDGEISRAEAQELACVKDRQLAKKQITWLRRHHYVRWLSLEDAEKYLVGILSKH